MACIVWFSGCGMRCGYCYNTEIVTGEAHYDYKDVLAFLDTRRGLLQGVVLCGGEALFSFDYAMFAFIQEIRKMGFLLKLDTNGINYQALEKLITAKLLDFVALDFKAPKNKFELVTQNKSHFYDFFLRSLEILIKSEIAFEIRTTLHQDLLTLEDIQEIVLVLDSLHYKGVYYLQNFIDGKKNFQNLSKKYNGFDPRKINKYSLDIEYRNF